jgi:O-glycosyl hydrolase
MALDTPTPKYHAARHYFRFIRPGAVRINIPSGRPTILASAFHHEANRTLTIVALNTGAADEPVTVTLTNAHGFHEFEAIRSSETQHSAELGTVHAASGSLHITLPAKCVTTLFGHGK